MKNIAEIVVSTLIASAVSIAVAFSEPAIAAEVSALVAVPDKRDDDLRVFLADGETVKGADALAMMASGKTDLNLWVAGNQYFAMADVVRRFQQENTAKPVVGLITLPPGLELDATMAGGWSYGGKDYRVQPDVIGQIDVGSLQQLKQRGLADKYVTYMHNELVLMVGKGNPKHVQGVDDLARADLQVMLPNPVSEGIMKIYAKPMLQLHGLWDKLADGKECQGCRTRPNVYFTTVHHREIPDGIKNGTTDVGIVWATEAKNAVAEAAPVEAINLPAKDSMKDDVRYVASALRTAPHAELADAYINFLSSAAAQDAYATFGFIRAASAELAAQNIP